MMPEWLALHCARCGRQLEAEAHAGPPRTLFAEGVLSVIAARMGWVGDLCPDCRC
jgi:hypothetical protein